MTKETRLVIDLFKKQIENGSVSENELLDAMLQIDKAIDKATIEKQNVTDLLLLRSDLQFLKY